MKRVVVAVGCSLVLACSAATPPPETPDGDKPAAEQAPKASPDGQIHRAELDVVLRQGPAWVLERVPLEEVMDAGKFVGWRVMSLPPDWQEIELQPGDVVTRINAMPLERPTDFFAAWTTLGVASELKISYRRDGKDQELSIPIFGQADPEMPGRLQKQPEQQPQAKPKHKPTITIPGNDRPLSDTVVEY